jgi:hypothetical protein
MPDPAGKDFKLNTWESYVVFVRAAAHPGGG